MLMRSVSLLFLSLLLLAMQHEKPAYQIFDAKGKKASYADMLKAASKADVIFFGEFHNNPICHWLQLQLTKDLHQAHQANLVLAAEMFEADDQLVLDEYLGGKIKESNFSKEAKLWDNYPTDYKPLVEFAKQNKLKFVAANVPRRYASMVASGSLNALNTLTDEAKRYIAPLPVAFDPELPGYKKMAEMMGGHGGPSAVNMVQAQAIKDATMAHFIAQNWAKGKVVLHYNGAYHSDNYDGIVWYLKKLRPELEILTISASEQAEVEKLADDAQNRAHFVVAIPADMTKTY